MTPAELEAMKHAYGLEHISDPEELRSAIADRDSAMNTLDRAATRMKIGTRLRELESTVPGARYSPASWSLLLTALLFVAFAALSFFGAARVSSLFLRIPAAIFGVIFFLAAWRAAARVIYRLFNRRDW
jgi:hypothetical protein